MLIGLFRPLAETQYVRDAQHARKASYRDQRGLRLTNDLPERWNSGLVHNVRTAKQAP